MIVRTGPTARHIVDHGPTPVPTKVRGSVNGSMVVPGPTKYHSRTPEQQAISNAQRATTRAGRAR